MSDNLTEDKFSNYHINVHITTTNSTTTATSIMVLISQENYSFNLLSRLYYYRNLQNDQYLEKHQSIYNSVI